MRPLIGAIRHASGAMAEAFLLAAIVAALALALSPIYAPAKFIAGTGGAFAGPKTSAIVVPDGVFGGTTTATVHTGPGTWVHAACSQGGLQVYEQYVQADSNDQAVLSLGPTPVWSSGAASCTAAEGTWASNGRFKVSATTTFSVSG